MTIHDVNTSIMKADVTEASRSQRDLYCLMRAKRVGNEYDFVSAFIRQVMARAGGFFRSVGKFSYIRILKCLLDKI
jgi:hypothetical protein